MTDLTQRPGPESPRTSTTRPWARGAWWAALVLTLLSPLVYLYVVAASMASDPCMGSTSDAGICNGLNQELAVMVPLLGWLIAVLFAWHFQARRTPTVRDRGVGACWLVAVCSLAFSIYLVSQQP